MSAFIDFSQAVDKLGSRVMTTLKEILKLPITTSGARLRAVTGIVKVEMDLVSVKLKIREKVVLHVARLKILCFRINISFLNQKFYAEVRIPSDFSFLYVLECLLKFIIL